MIAHKGRHIVAGGIPTGFTWHSVENLASVYLQSFESYICDFPFLVISIDDRETLPATTSLLMKGSSISDVSESHIFYSSARCGTVFLVVAHLHLKNRPTTDWLDTYVVEHYVSHEVIVATVDGQASLIVYLRFPLS